MSEKSNKVYKYTCNILAGTVLVFLLLLQHRATTEPQILGVQLTSAEAGPRGSLAEDHLVLPFPTSEAFGLENVQAKSYLVFDEQIGRTLLAGKEEQPLPVASLTKLMTVYVAQKYLNLQNSIVIEAADKVSVRPVLGLVVGDEVSPHNLSMSALVGSANDAVTALARAVEQKTGRPFTELMNQEAANLGMTQSHFSNPIGFDSPENFASAMDISKLIAACLDVGMFDQSGRLTSYSFTSKQGRRYGVKATNKLISTHEDISAIKTGYTNEAEGAMAVRVSNNGYPFVIIVLGSPTRESDTLLIKDIVEKSFAWE